MVSSHWELLTPAMEALSSLIYPLQPIFVYITNLPGALTDFIQVRYRGCLWSAPLFVVCQFTLSSSLSVIADASVYLLQAPTPFMYGLLKANYVPDDIPDHVPLIPFLSPYVMLTRAHTQVAVVDLDTNSIRMPSFVPALPPRFRNKLLRCIQRHAPLYTPPRGRTASVLAAESPSADAPDVPNSMVTRKTLSALYSSSEESEDDDDMVSGPQHEEIPLLPFAEQGAMLAVAGGPTSLPSSTLKFAEAKAGAIISNSPSPSPSPSPAGGSLKAATVAAAVAVVAEQEPQAPPSPSVNTAPADTAASPQQQQQQQTVSDGVSASAEATDAPSQASAADAEQQQPEPQQLHQQQQQQQQQHEQQAHAADEDVTETVPIAVAEFRRRLMSRRVCAPWQRTTDEDVTGDNAAVDVDGGVVRARGVIAGAD